MDGSYRYGVDAGFDPKSGTLWMKRSQSGGPTTLSRTMAAQLVFKPEARPIDHLALEAAIELDIQDPSYAGAEGVRSGAGADELTMNGAELNNSGDGLEEALFGHSPFEPDPARNAPRPVPIPSVGTSRHPGPKKRPDHKRSPACAEPGTTAREGTD